MMMRILLVVLVALGAVFWFVNRPVTHAPGVLAPQAPHQRLLEAAEAGPASPMRHRGYHLTPVAHFEAEARVLGKKPYRDDPNAALAPYDLAIGWGPMSDTAVLDAISVVQTQRVYTWRSEHYPISPKEIVRHSTNMHVIPGSSAVEAALLKVRAGHLVRLSGRLVNVVGNDGGRWRTSLSRTDAGVGACEIIWLEQLDILDA